MSGCGAALHISARRRIIEDGQLALGVGGMHMRIGITNNIEQEEIYCILPCGAQLQN